MTARCTVAAARTAIAVAALTLTVLTLPCGIAAANEYHVFSCEDPYTGQGAPAAGWDYDQGTNGYGDGANSSCSNGGGSISAWLAGGVTHGFGEGGYATFNAPGQMTISTFALWRYEAVGPDEPYAAPATNIAYNPGNVSLEGLCAQSDDCVTRGTNQRRLAAENRVGASNLVDITEIEASAVCGGGPGTSYVCPESNAENGNSAEVDIYAADIVLNDPTIPAVTGVSGPLVSGAVLTGDASVSFLASDSGGPGIYSGTITVDGQPQVGQVLDTNRGECQSLNATTDGLRSFNYPQPCKSQVSATMTLDTSSLPAGAHNVVVSVDDASGNSTIVWDGTIITAHPDLPNGDPACEQAMLTLSVDRKGAEALIRYGTRPKVSGTVMCAKTPIADATIAIIGGGLNTSVTTDQSGTFVYRVPRGPNRTISFSSRAFSNDPGPAAEARARIAVLPRIRLRITPRRTRNGGTIDWSGKISGGPYPADGISLLVEVREGHRWQPFDEVVAVHGRFGYRYTFLRTTQPTTYRFRVALPASGSAGYDYQAGGSNAVNVHVS